MNMKIMKNVDKKKRKKRKMIERPFGFLVTQKQQAVPTPMATTAIAMVSISARWLCNTSILPKQSSEPETETQRIQNEWFALSLPLFSVRKKLVAISVLCICNRESFRFADDNSSRVEICLLRKTDSFCRHVCGSLFLFGRMLILLHVICQICGDLTLQFDIHCISCNDGFRNFYRID